MLLLSVHCMQCATNIWMNIRKFILQYYSFSSGYQLKIGLGMGYMFTSPPLSRNVTCPFLCILPRCELMHPSCCKPLATIGLLFDSLCILYFFTPFLYGCFSESYRCFEQTTNKKQFKRGRAYSGSRFP